MDRVQRATNSITRNAIVAVVALVAGVLVTFATNGAGAHDRPSHAIAAAVTQIRDRVLPDGRVAHAAFASAATTTRSLVPDGDAEAASAAPMVGGASDKSGNGYWMVATNGGVYSVGDAAFRGSAGGIALARPIVGMAATSTGNGYWLVATDGGIFSYGDATFYGSTGAIRLNRPIVGMAPTPSGRGYWLVASDGGIFSYGDATFYGSTGAIHLNSPIVGMAATGAGYWLVAADGGVFSFGDALFEGAAPGGPAAVGIASSGGNTGYWVARSDGSIQSFGDAPDLPSGAGELTANAVSSPGLPSGRGLLLVGADGNGAVLTPGGATATGVPSIPPVGNSNAYSYLVTNPDGSPVRYDPCTPIHYQTNVSGGPANAAALVAGAIRQVSQATGLQFIFDGPTNAQPDPNAPLQVNGHWAPVLISWATAATSSLLPNNSVAGEGGSWWVQGPTGQDVFVTGAVAVSESTLGRLGDSFGSGSTEGQLLLHEIGHVVGLGHTQDPNQIMFPTLLPLTSANYQAGDLAGLSHLGKAGGCLNAPTP